MKVIVNGKDVEVTDAMREYAEKKLQKLSKFFKSDLIETQVTFRVEGGLHIVDATVQVNGLLLRGEEKTQDMYASIDGVIDKVERQIRKYKTKINRRLRKEGGRLIENAFEEEALKEEEKNGPKIVRTKRFAIKPMDEEEAAMQMELLGHDFFVFYNASTDEVNVLYRRKDGNYGLIEPEF